MIDEWIDRKTGLIMCPKCGSYSVARITVPWEGEKYICSSCGKDEIIFTETASKKIRRGFGGGMFG